MKHIRIFLEEIKNSGIALTLFLMIWGLLSLFYESYLIPSPLELVTDLERFVDADFKEHLGITLLRITIGAAVALVAGFSCGVLSYFLRIKEALKTLFFLFQMLPGTVIGVVLLLILGEGNLTPIALIIFLITPMIAINTANSLNNNRDDLRKMITIYGGRRWDLIRDLYFPMLIPVFKSSLTIGIGFSAKIVILGEFIAASSGLGYLLSVAKTYFDMKAVFFYMAIIIFFVFIIHFIINLFFVIFWEKYLLKHG